MTKKSFLATVQFVDAHQLSALATSLGRAIDVVLAVDESGRYDEVPAFVGEVAGLHLSLLGSPQGHETRESVLTVQMRTELSFVDLYASTPDVFREILVEKVVNARGFIDCSNELAQALVARGFSDCSPADRI